MTLHIPQSDDRYVRAPIFETRHDGLWLRCIAWYGGEGRERILRFRVRPDGTLGGELKGSSRPRIMSHRGDALRETRFDGEAGSVQIDCEGGVASVWLREPRKVLVWQAAGSASSPVACATPQGILVAWHHDVREDTGRADVAKWIAIRLVTPDGEVLEPAAAMTDRDRDRKGEEQSFEFPSLVASGTGAVCILGRGSHCFWRQDLTDAGFTSRTPLSEGGWGSRGRRCVGARVDGGILVARRERRSIEVELLPPVEGGAPTWVPATVVVTAQDLPELDQNDQQEREDPAAAFGMRTCFGDIQQHSAHSDGVGSADEAYLRARDRYGDDFVALTDHESFLGKRTSPGEWEYLKAVADRYEEAGSFATLLAYEWTGKMYPGPGHKCVYVPSRDSPVISRDELPSGRAFVREAGKHGFMTSPHHIGWTGCDEDGHDPAVQPTWEICSCHGCYEHADHPLGMRGEHTSQLAKPMLDKGHRFGFTASSDSHGLLWHHGESRKRDPYRTGLTAVQVATVQRDAIFEALRHRRCYATSGVKILLDFRVDDQPMGSELTATGGWARGVATGVSALARVEVVTPDGVIAGEVDGRRGRLEVRIDGVPYAYLRVVQQDGEMAWSSPVFFGLAG